MEQTQTREELVLASLGDEISKQKFVPDYANHRNALVSGEHEFAWDAAARRTASAAELAAQDIIFKIRESERRDPLLFGNLPSEAVPHEDTRDLGGRFLKTKPRIESSRIFAIASQLPKGAHQHVHFNCELQPERLLLRAREPVVENTLCIRSTIPLCSVDDFHNCEIVFKIVPAHIPRVDIFSADYKPDKSNLDGTAFMLWKDFRARFPTDTSFLDDETADDEGLLTDGLDHAELWARQKTIVRRDHAYSEDQTHNGIWACFNQGTRAFKGLLGYESVYRWYVGELIDSMVRDHVMYAELRPMLMDKLLPSDDGLRMLNHADQMNIIVEETAKRRALYDAQDSVTNKFLGIKIIYSTPRSIPRTREDQGRFPSCMEIELEDCLKLKMQFPELICGFDLVGAEDRPNPIRHYADLLRAFRKTCDQFDLEVPFLFHAGESLLDTGGSLSPDNSNLYDAYLLGARRIGHGYAILKHPQLVELYKQKGICLELCPISNELLHLCGNIRQHPYPQILAAGLHCTVSGDNPSMYRSSLSHEFYQVMVGDPRMTLHGWKQLAQWSLEHSCLTPDELKEALRIHALQFEQFCDHIVLHYGEVANTLARRWLPELML